MKRGELSQTIRRRLERFPPPYSNAYGVVPPAPPDVINLQPLGGVAFEAMSALERLTSETAHMGVALPALRALERREAVESSQIEGTRTEFDELLALEALDEEAGDADARHTRNYVRALDWVLERARQGPSAFDANLILDLHRRLMEPQPYAARYGQTPGQWRTGVVWIGAAGDISRSSYNPPPPDRLPSCMAEHLDYLTSAPELGRMPPAARLAIAHAHFEAIHPFFDGNGRVGRLLLPAMLVAEGYPAVYLGAYLKASQAAYYAKLRAVQCTWSSDAWRDLIGFVCIGISESVKDTLTTAMAVQQLQQLWQARLHGLRRDAAARRAVEQLPERPVVTVRDLQRRLGVSMQAANTAVARLVKYGVLSELPTRRRQGRLFQAHELMRVYNRAFGAQPEMPEASTPRRHEQEGSPRAG